MATSPFHAMYAARQLAEFSHGADKLVPAYASSDIEIYPYQIAAAMFALRSPYLKGAVLADEGSLGKTYESLLVISQLYFEGRDRILVIVPTPLLRQWSKILENRFSVPFEVVDHETTASGNPFDSSSVVLTTYEYAALNTELIEKIEWNIAVFEEAHRLAKPDNKTTITLKATVGDAFKLLLTATPMQNSIMDLYGLIEFIDTGALGDADAFYKRYFRKPENYGELTATASRYCFRTLRSQVENYVKIPRRIPVTADYPLSANEVKLSAMVDDYLKKQVMISPEFLALWEKIKGRTSYRVTLNEDTLKEQAITTLSKMEKVPKARVVTRTARVNVENAGVSVSGEYERSQEIDGGGHRLPNFIRAVDDECFLSRRSSVDISVGCRITSTIHKK